MCSQVDPLLCDNVSKVWTSSGICIAILSIEYKLYALLN